ncbi:adenylate/guanylate cyclase domain-containing protein [Leptospira ilyithenensis]|uniref:Adenylate/guanylate cyclase domain-containing protein n=1 Tax=Leptospira ilyithenensis TaxID=2484901 RepID=A0A4V3JXB9_9LEPT|nr:adenylate/guanylate cyclase domain-containing protein [Leptospira ilyithenensis]TGN13204.1 adenylate/guanylate cyclase domain-containing protein [Leptospira ilyithenensis]
MDLIFGWKNRLRLGSGLVLFTYVFTHLLNHSLGIFSLDLLESSRKLFIGFWRFPVIHPVLFFATSIHIILTLSSILSRKTLKMSKGEFLQFFSGLVIPQLLIGHIAVTLGMNELLGVEDSYTHLFLVYGSFFTAIDITLLLVVWAHGCFGLYFWLRYKPWFVSYSNLFLVIVSIFPVLSIMGIISAQKEVFLLSQDPEWLEDFFLNLPEKAEWIKEYSLQVGTLANLAFNFVIFSLFVFRLFFLRSQNKKKTIKVHYPNGKISIVSPGTTILEASKLAKLPHANVCGGRGRCSTCRVHIESGLEELDSPSEEEIVVLARISAPKSVRLACQTIPKSDIYIEPLLPTNATAIDAIRQSRYIYGTEKEIVILFADLRGFTTFTEQLLPYDVVFILNSYFQQVGSEIEKAGGKIDKLMGDGLMAIFGLDSNLTEASNQAVLAIQNMSEQLVHLNERLQKELPQPLRMGIGIHSGVVILGTFGNSTTPTAIGDAVNTASRLESATKEYSCEVIISEDVAKHSLIDFSKFEKHTISVRGKTESVNVYLIPFGRDLKISKVETALN